MAGNILDFNGKSLSIGDQVLFTRYHCEQIAKGKIVKITSKNVICQHDDYNWWKAQIHHTQTRDRIIKL